jgi:lipopolysaccharide heptosyltransferase I
MADPGKKFLFIKVSSLGDVVHALPALRTLRASHPDAYIAWLVEAPYQNLLYNNPDLDEIIVIRTRHWRKNWTLKTLGEISKTISLLRKRRFDVAIDLQGLIKTGLIARLSGARQRLGLHRKNCKEPLNALFTNKKAATIGPGTHVVDIYLNLIHLAGGNQQVTQIHPLNVPEATSAPVDLFLQENPEISAKPIAFINPGAGFPTKLWEADRFAKLADRIVEELGFSILLVWGPGEKGMAEQIGGMMKQKSWIAPKTSIQESIVLFRHAALLISCDTGPLHLAAAMGVPTVSLFGPTDPARNGPYGLNHQVVCKPQPCSFCWKKACHIQTHDCMQQIEVEEVFETVKTSVAKFVNVAAS